MKKKPSPFSKRYGHTSAVPEITIREGAPEELRVELLATAKEVGLRPSDIRAIICRVLKKRPDPSNWSEYPNVWNEVEELAHECDWFRVYDIIEAIHASLDPGGANAFQDSINDTFVELGIGWQLTALSTIQTRGPEVFEATVASATEALETTERATAAREIHEALRALSRRPEADLTGAVYHAMAAVECVARDVSGHPKATLGDVLKRNPHLLPKPLDQAASKLWGYASDQARHMKESNVLGHEEVELVVGVAASLATYLAKKTALSNVSGNLRGIRERDDQP